MVFVRVLNAMEPVDADLAMARLGGGAPAEVLARQGLAVLVSGLDVEAGARVVRLAGGDLRATPGPGAVLLEGARDAVHRVLEAAAAGGVEASLALRRRFDPPRQLQVGPATFDLTQGPVLMGIVNVTPDSFSDGGRFVQPSQAVQHGLAMIASGAQVLDVGGESTRPGAAPVSAEEELARVLPVVEGLVRAAPRIPVSIDTSKAEVARRCVEAGARLINDVTALGDPAMASVAASSGASLCLMHMQGEPRTMQVSPTYADVLHEVAEALAVAVARAEAAGVSRARLLIDPGFGFGKTVEHNYLLHRRLADLRALGLPVLVGTSRKSMLGKVLGDRPAPQRVVASAVSVGLLAAAGGADVVRVHDVAEARDALAVARAARQGGALLPAPTPAHVGPTGA